MVMMMVIVGCYSAVMHATESIFGSIWQISRGRRLLLSRRPLSKDMPLYHRMLRVAGVVVLLVTRTYHVDR